MKAPKSKTKAPKAEDKVLNKVKNGAVTKPSSASKAKAKEVAKKLSAKSGKESEKRKKKAPTPSESSESDSDEEMKNASSGSESESESESDSGSESEAEEKAAAPVKAAAAKPEAESGSEKSSESESESEEESESESESEEADSAPASKAKKPVEKKSEPKDSEESEDSEEDEDESEESSEESPSEDEEKPGKSQKRKADSEETPVSKKAKQESNNEAPAEGGNLFIGNLSWNVDEEWLRSEFEGFGELSGVRIVTDRDSGRSRGFGYVEFTNAADATKAFDAKKDTEIDGRKINVDFANARQNAGAPRERAQSRAKNFGDQTSPESDTLFIGNISFGADENTIQEAFSSHGSILGIRLPTDPDSGRPKGFGYVQFSSSDEARSALNALQGSDLAGRSMRLDFSSPRQNSGGSFGGRGGGRGGRGGRGAPRGGPRGGGRGGRGGFSSGGGFGDFSGKKTTF
ncbi:nuclear localization sequence binding protein [Ophidiomyces ophidiicola]|uniref:Nuclear localization sequence binding protein n=1 Tax=Ophidiomyces ophidiicola TaxID=1387563 RepID=A0ACB8UNW3_9EURO|nr:nuclear localization sequence binding protein [Ophidiomyces ophidiicola]KAI1949942.1 nuclear localization sequence binding protein [Ophidiomyces ophidiicola]KAI1999680.1 nuclear localization sequence binding protein [Ophidiomyces ophidiicola]KAI2030833.1 nuclear localization sequence binding protein [Ophidiomyces ophidiicola]KAI2045414.1 nuclear localization sequence binding protein [Ophidiomyces ophidiicola]